MSHTSANSTVSIAEQLLDNCLERLYQNVKLPPSTSTATTTTTTGGVNSFEAYIKPNKLLAQDYDIKTNIARIAVNPFPREYKFDPLPTDKLKDILTLKAPRVVVTQNYARFPPASSTVPAFTGAPPAKRLKTLAKSSSTSNISASTGAPGSLPASTSNRNLAAAAAVAPAVTAPIPAAPSSSAGSVHITNNNNANKSSKPIPDNFYEIVKPIFQREFVEIEYDDVKVNCAFFAKIMYSNCRDYGMEHFAPDPMNFDIINEKLAKKQYRSVDEFLSDFHTVLKNIVTYFPMDHPARKEVDVVREKFDSHWQHMQHRFKW